MHLVQRNICNKLNEKSVKKFSDKNFIIYLFFSLRPMNLSDYVQYVFQFYYYLRFF